MIVFHIIKLFYYAIFLVGLLFVLQWIFRKIAQLFKLR